MNNTTNPSGLMSASPKERSDLLKLIHNTFGPAPTKPQSLEQRLASLTEAELKQVMQWAKFVKMSHSFGKTNQAKSYAQLTHEMYGKFDDQRKSLIADLLQEADPVDAVGYTPPKAVVSYRDEIGDEWLRATSQPTPSPAAVTKPNKAAPAGPYKDKAAFIAAITPTIPAAVSNSGFMRRLAQSESSGDSNAEITINDGRRFVGSLQFGAARLSDYKKHSGKTFTQDEFKADTALQDEVADWHLADIDKAIDALGDKAQGYDRDGLRSVAHLGGKGGMRQFVKSKGQYNPTDELGTSLQFYYDKFSS